jgi:MoxR-like ATPase
MKFISPATVIEALRVLSSLSLKRVGRTSLMGYLLLKAKETPGVPLQIYSQGPASVEPELIRFFRVAPGSPLPDVNPFGSQEGALEYLAEGYERRGTYTHLYEGRNLSGFLKATPTDGAFKVEIPSLAATAIVERLGKKVPLYPTAAFLLRSVPFQDTADADAVIHKFVDLFHLSQTDLDNLFDHTTDFEISFSNDQFQNELSSLPDDLRPKVESTAHAGASHAARSIVPLAKASSIDLVIDEALRRRAVRAIASSKAVALVGPPGTAKSRLLATLLEEARSDPGVLGMGRPPSYLSVTAEVDWTARTIVGGYYPQEDGKLVFREGFFLQALKNDQLLLIDEMNRADLDRVLGPVLTFLAGQSVDLGITHLGSDGAGSKPKKMILAWSSNPESGCKEDDEQRVYYAGTDWRLLGTYNNVDRGKVFPLGSALQRRWALVPVFPVSKSLAEQILAQTGVRGPVAQILAAAYDLHLKFLSIGIAPFLDIARYVGGDSANVSPDPSPHERELLDDAYVLYMGQQLTRLDPDTRQGFFDELAIIFGSNLASEAAKF